MRKYLRYVSVLAILLLLGVAPVVKADTVGFNITVTSNQLNQDPKSKRVLKNTTESFYAASSGNSINVKGRYTP